MGWGEALLICGTGVPQKSAVELCYNNFRARSALPEHREGNFHKASEISSKSGFAGVCYLFFYYLFISPFYHLNNNNK